MLHSFCLTNLALEIHFLLYLKLLLLHLIFHYNSALEVPQYILLSKQQVQTLLLDLQCLRHLFLPKQQVQTVLLGFPILHDLFFPKHQVLLVLKFLPLQSVQIRLDLQSVHLFFHLKHNLNDFDILYCLFLLVFHIEILETL